MYKTSRFQFGYGIGPVPKVSLLSWESKVPPPKLPPPKK